MDFEKGDAVISRRQLYAAGEPLGDGATRKKLGGGYVCGLGGSSNSSSQSDTITTNTDARVAVEDGTGISNSDYNTINVNSTDAVKAIAQLGTETIRATGDSVVKLHETTTAANVTQWDKTVSAGAQLVDKLIDASTTLGTSAIDRYQPAENKAQDTSLKLGMIAAAGVAATLLLSKMK